LSRYVVHGDPDLSDLIPGFLEHKRDDLAAIVKAIEDADYETLAKFGHKIKGEGGSYGLDRISEIGAAIDVAAKARDLAEVRELARQFADFLDNVEVVYD
jgi:HPt (histidine-containing phosphotransfer) domain-containing protein